MKKFNRRQFIQGSAAMAAASGYSSVSHALFSSKKPLRSERKAVVIGSGFGGSVAALRLTQAGIPTMLLERGRNWAYQGESTFPTLTGFGDGMLWREPKRYASGATGMMQEYFSDSVAVGVGAGLGGGSLVYGGVLLQPRRELFEAVMPNIDYDAMNATYFPRVLSRVSGGPIPDDILQSPNYTAMRTFIENATLAGMDVVRSEVGFDWDIIREEVQGLRTAYASVGEYVFGCNSGAKNTLDKNYLTEAAQTGRLDIQTLHNVDKIVKKRFDNRYEIHCDVLNEDCAIIGKHIIETQYLFMAAGSIHTTRLLLKAQHQRDINGMTDALGAVWGTNGDELMARTGIDGDTGPVQGGPPSIAAFDMNNPYKPTAFMHSPSLTNPDHMQLQMGMCISDNMSRAEYNPWFDSIAFNWDKDQNETAHNALIHTMENMTRVGGGNVVNLRGLGTWHPLGGSVMGVATDDKGAVDGVDNLFVVDGALLPGSSGVANPSLTIGANAERVMEQIIPTLN